MAPTEQHPDEDEPAPTTPPIEPDEYMEEAPRTNGGETAPPETFGVAGSPDAAKERAAESSDPRGDQAPEEDRYNEPSA